MLSKFSVAAIGLAVAGFSVVSTPVMARLGGPASLPPAGFKGQQFIDADGCLFLRAGFGAQTVWVPMVDGGHKPICGMAPTFGGGQVVAAAEPAPAAPVVAVPAAPKVAAIVAPAAPAVAAPVVAPKVAMAAPVVQAAPVVAPAPPVVQPAPAAKVAPGVAAAPKGYSTAPLGAVTASCFTGSPVLERVVLRNGGTALVCTAGDGTLNNWRSPQFAANAGFGAALGYTPATAANMQGARVASAVAPQVVAAATVNPPKGWKAAWKDDRLNPMRGVGTAEGQAMQDQVWTRTVPAKPVAPVAKVAVAAAQTAAPVTRVSTMSSPAKAAVPAATGSFFVQIGSFGQASNADGASARTAALGLPVSKGKITKGGKSLQVIYAGPFASAGEAQAALSALHGAGFGDAFIR